MRDCLSVVHPYFQTRRVPLTGDVCCQSADILEGLYIPSALAFPLLPSQRWRYLLLHFHLALGPAAMEHSAFFSLFFFGGPLAAHTNLSLRYNAFYHNSNKLSFHHIRQTGNCGNLCLFSCLLVIICYLTRCVVFCACSKATVHFKDTL